VFGNGEETYTQAIILSSLSDVWCRSGDALRAAFWRPAFRAACRSEVFRDGDRAKEV